MNRKILKLASAVAFFSVLISCSNENLELDHNINNSSLLKKATAKWCEDDLYAVLAYKIGNLKSRESSTSFKLDQGLLIQEITKEQYDLASKNMFRYYLQDTLVLMKRQNVIKIGKTVLKDKVLQKKAFEFYRYLGYFPVLDQYLIQGQYLDSLDYKMIDKTSGTIKQSLKSYPIISSNGNFIAVCKTNDLEQQTYLEIFNYSHGFYQNAFQAIFTNWGVSDFEEHCFWGKDGSLYLKIYKLRNQDIKKEAYLRITLN